MSCIPGALVIALGFAASAELVAAQGGRVEGRVTAAASGAPIPSAEVSVVGTNLGTRTNAEGRFALLELDAVVVTGTAGVARVREVGNSIAKVNLAEVKDPPANMDQLLQARAPGLSVMQTSGMAGEGAQSRLRGRVSVTQGNPPTV